MWRFDHPLIGCFGYIIAFDGFRADPLFIEEFDGRTEEVMEDSPLAAIEVIEERYGQGVIESLVSEPLPDVGPVFLFDVGVVIFVIGAGTGELDRVFSFGEVLKKGAIEKLGAIVGIEAQEGERERFFDILDLFQDTGFPFPPGSPLFGPCGGDVDGVNGIGEHAGERFPAMGDSVSFEKPWTGFIPLICQNGDLVSEQGPRFGGAATSFLILNADGLQEPVYGGRRDRKQSVRNLFG